MKTLLIIDMQNGFIKNEKDIEVNKKINNLINKNIYDKYIFTKFINDASQNPLFEEKLNWHKLKNINEQSFSLPIPPNSIVMQKTSYGIKQEDINYIKSLNIKTIDVCGVKAEACVYAIALQLWDNGIHPNILINYVNGNKDMKEIYKKQFGIIDTKE